MGNLIFIKVKCVLFKLILFILLINHNGYTQRGLSHEIGFTVGSVYVQSDYGERGDASTFFKNNGLALGLVHYLNFGHQQDCSCLRNFSFFNNHFRIRNELSYFTADLRHEGRWVSLNKTSLIAEQLRAMRGSTAILSFGTQLEYYPFGIYNPSGNKKNLAPYISLGVHYASFNPEASSTLGPLGIAATTPTKYNNAFSSERGNTFSIVGNLGSRIKLDDYTDFLVDMRWQYFDSDWVDGLNPNKALYSENKYNDWLFSVNVGVVFYLSF